MTLPKYILLAALPVTLLSCGGRGAATPETAALTPAQRLEQRLRAIVADSCFMYGHHDDTAYGYTWNNQDIPEAGNQDTTGRSDVKDVCGDYPGVINWDLGMLECAEVMPLKDNNGPLSGEKACLTPMDQRGGRNLDDVPFSRIAREIVKHDARGGINTISWHPLNPVTGKNSWDNSDSTVVRKIVTPGTKEHIIFQRWAMNCADFIGALRDAEGNRIPVVFRPWHEHTGSWFWWGKDLCTVDEYKALWRLTRAIFDAEGIDNVLWCYSPDRIGSLEEYTERYPGDEYVDILGADVYMFGMEDGIADYLSRARMQLQAATDLSRQNGKLVTLSETGHETVPLANWYDEILLPLCKEFPIAYVCVWRNAYPALKPNHFYAPYAGHSSVPGFLNFYNDPKTLFCKETANYK